jgi:hypothetical protein
VGHPRSLHLTTRNNKYILVSSDVFSRFEVSIAILDTTAATAHMLIMHWVAYFRVPNFLMSDCSRFTSEMMRDVAAILGIRLLFTALYHPEANGTVERLNQTFTAMVKKFVNRHVLHKREIRTYSY